jgi:hypothetical protein
VASQEEVESCGQQKRNSKERLAIFCICEKSGETRKLAAFRIGAWAGAYGGRSGGARGTVRSPHGAESIGKGLFKGSNENAPRKGNAPRSKTCMGHLKVLKLCGGV